MALLSCCGLQSYFLLRSLEGWYFPSLAHSTRGSEQRDREIDVKSVRSHFKLGNFDSCWWGGQKGRACLVEMGKKMEVRQQAVSTHRRAGVCAV